MPKKPVSALVQITKSPIPPLHQSTENLMACKRNYVTQVIQGRKQPGGLESRRGNEVHHTGSQYFSHCARKCVAMDLDAFDELSKGAGPVAARILSGMRDSYEVDFSALLATEIRLSLDENFEPTDVPDELGGVSVDTGLPACYSGTLDGLYMYKEESRSAVHDLKTHPRPFDPDETLQAKMYCTFVMKHFPWVEQVLFRLIFCRYKNLVRECTFTRADLPKLIEAIKAARERQRVIHLEYDEHKEIEATSGAHCIYCPLLSNRECPISEWNPQSQLSPEDRLKFHLWYSAFSKVNNAALKDYVNGTGKNVILRDYNQKIYSYGPTESESDIFPLFEATATGIATDKEGNPSMPIISLLMDYAHSTPGDVSWYGKLSISSTELKSKLKAKSRVNLHQAITDTAEKVTKVKLKVSKPLDSIEEEPDDDYEDNDFGEGDEF